MNKFPHSDETSAPGAVNPATSLPMINGDTAGVDVGGSPFGFDIHEASSREIGSGASSAFKDIFGSLG